MTDNEIEGSFENINAALKEIGKISIELPKDVYSQVGDCIDIISKEVASIADWMVERSDLVDEFATKLDYAKSELRATTNGMQAAYESCIKTILAEK